MVAGQPNALMAAIIQSYLDMEYWSTKYINSYNNTKLPRYGVLVNQIH